MEKHYKQSWLASSIFVLILALLILPKINRIASAQGLSDVGVCTWLGCKEGAASFSIDDGNPICRAELENAGFRGTYYYNGSTTQSWFAEFSNAGHEIGSHTVSHWCDAPSCSPNCTPEDLWQIPYTQQELTFYRQNQLEPNLDAIEAGTGKPVVSLAWSCGITDACKITAASSYFIGARGYFDQYGSYFTWVQDVEDTTPTELYNLKSAADWDPTFIDRAISEGKWANIVTHEVCSGISYIGARQDQLWAAPVGDVLKYIQVRNAASFSNYSRTAQAISFEASHNLPVFQRQRVDGSSLLPIVYDNPVTLQVLLQSTDGVSGVMINGQPVPYSEKTIQGARYVLIDTPLNTVQSISITLGGDPPPPSSGFSLWDNSAVPAQPSSGDNQPVEVGVQFRADLDGYITGLRFYKGLENTGTHLGHLWTGSGTLLAEATFVDESASGWQTVYFNQPVPVSASTPYVASYHTDSGYFSSNDSYFTTGRQKGPLYAFASSEIANGNGVYHYGDSTFPDQSYNSANYWVDVIFVNGPAFRITNPTVTYNGQPQAASVIADEDSPIAGQISNIRYNGVVNVPVDAGTYAVTVDFMPEDTANYENLSGVSAGNFVIAKAIPSPTFQITNSPVYNSQPHAAAVSVQGPVTGAISNIRYDGATSAPVGAGTYALTVDFTPEDTDNYESLTGVSAGSFVIAKAIPNPIFRISNSPIYNGQAQLVVVELDEDSPVSGTISNIRYNGDASAPVNAGAFAITVDFTPADTDNYVNLAGVSAGSFVIAKAAPNPGFKIMNSGVIYNGQPQAAVVEVDEDSPISGTISNIRYNGAANAPVNAGTYAVTVDFTPADTDNYESLIEAPAGAFVIAGAAPALTLVKTAAEMTFTQAGDVIHYSYTLANSGDVSLEGPFTVTDGELTVICPPKDSLALTESVICTAAYTITALDVQAGAVTNTATGFGSYAGEEVKSNAAKLTVSYKPAEQPLNQQLFIPLIFGALQSQPERGTGLHLLPVKPSRVNIHPYLREIPHV